MAGEIGFLPSADDYAAAQRAHFVSGLRSHKFWIRLPLAILFAGLAFAALVLLVDGDPGGALVAGACAAIGGAGGAAVVVVANWLLLPRRSRRLYAQQKTLHVEHRLGWSETGLRWQSRESNTLNHWADYHRWREGPDAILVYLSDNLFHFIPSRALSDAEREDLVATVAAGGVPK